MPCYTRDRTAEENAARKARLDALAKRIASGTARLDVRGKNVSIEGFLERVDECDACLVRGLQQHADFRVRAKLAAIPHGAVFGHAHTHADGTTHTH